MLVDNSLKWNYWAILGEKELAWSLVSGDDEGLFVWSLVVRKDYLSGPWS